MRLTAQKKPTDTRKKDLWDQQHITDKMKKLGDVSHLTGVDIPELHATVYPRQIFRGTPRRKPFDEVKVRERYIRNANKMYLKEEVE